VFLLNQHYSFSFVMLRLPVKLSFIPPLSNLETHLA
jgi:hypothetical protein